MKRKVSNDELFDEVSRMLSQGKTVRLPAKGSSMRPFISGEKDTLVISPLRSVGLWDVVLAKIPGHGHLVHRVIGKKDDYIVLMGDGNLYGMEQCRREDVLGRVERVIRHGKERSMLSVGVRIRARVWHQLLPLRRLLVRSVFFCR